MKKLNDVYVIVKKIPKGKVMTYGQIGKILSISPRQVGRILHENPDPSTIPCHRIVNSKGEVSKSYAFGGASRQEEKLKDEKVEFARNKVNLKKCLYKSNH